MKQKVLWFQFLKRKLNRKSNEDSQNEHVIFESSSIFVIVTHILDEKAPQKRAQVKMLWLRQ